MVRAVDARADLEREGLDHDDVAVVAVALGVVIYLDAIDKLDLTRGCMRGTDQTKQQYGLAYYGLYGA